MIDSLPGEKWKDITGYEGLYQVSTEGRVKRLPYDRAKRNQWNSYVQHYPERLLIANPDREGYCQVGLTNSDGMMKQFKVHRLVMEAFSPEWDPNKEVDHIFGVKHDNRLSQLRMVTTEENNYHFWNDDAFEKERQNKFYNKTFSQSTRDKISEKNRKRKGGKWVHKGSERKYIRPEEVDDYICQGYLLGWGDRQGQQIKGSRRCIHKDGRNKYVNSEDVDQYLKDGWQLGGCTGIIFSDERRRNISESLKGKTYGERSNDTKKKISDALKGRTISEEHRLHIKEAQHKRRIRENECK